MDLSAIPSKDRAFTANGEWPVSDLEALGECPICTDRRRTLMFSGLRDFAFASAAGEWSMWQCQLCGAAYLDPRPRLESISRAYSRYYTHQLETENQQRENGALRWFKRWLGTRLLNDYANRTYGHHLPALPSGAAISIIWPVRRRRVDHQLRHLPAPTSVHSALLDVGCGNGDFVKVATSLGFRAIGVDPDEKATASARLQGLDVRTGNFPGSGLPRSSFEHITANHVLEHLHDPKEAIRELFKLLQPGGRLWLSQPNLAAIGLKEFGMYWRGLEAPRHLTLFNTDGMGRLLESCGFVKVSLLPPEPVAQFYYRQSQCHRLGVDPYRCAEPPGWRNELEWNARDADARAGVDPQLGESLTMVAWRPR